MAVKSEPTNAVAVPGKPSSARSTCLKVTLDEVLADMVQLRLSHPTVPPCNVSNPTSVIRKVNSRQDKWRM